MKGIYTILMLIIFLSMLLILIRKYWGHSAHQPLGTFGCRETHPPRSNSAMLPLLRLEDFVHKDSPTFTPDAQVIFRPGTLDPEVHRHMRHIADKIMQTMNAYNSTSFQVVGITKIIQQTSSKDKTAVMYSVDFEAHDTISNCNKNLLLCILVQSDNKDYTITKLEERTRRRASLCHSQQAQGGCEQTMHSSLEHSPICYSQSQAVESPYEQSCRQATASFPSNRIYHEWDKLSLHILDAKRTSSGGYDYSFGQRPLTPTFNPTLATLPRSVAAHTMFDKSYGQISFPRST